MIQGEEQINTEQEYRAITIDSASSLKEFSLDRKKYFRKFIANEEIEEKDNQAIIMGNLVETLLFEKDLFDDKFYISSCISPPTGLMLSFVEALYDVTKESTNDEGEVTKDFSEISMEAYDRSGFKHSYERVMNGTKNTVGFINSDAEIYYNEIRTVRSKNLTVVSSTNVTNAENIVNGLRNNFVTKDILSLVDDQRWEVYVQYQVEGFVIDGHPFKSMLDLVVIDHENREVQIYDLKCVWAVEGFYREYYLYRRAYIQAYVYYRALEELSYDENVSFFDYKILPPRFIVSDSTNYYNPLIYKLSEQDLTDAYEGFEYRGYNYPGVKDIIKDLQWASSHNIWNISRLNHESNGIVNIKPL